MVTKRERKEEPKNGQLYREQMLDVPGGYGIISWDSFNCLTPLQSVVWLKLCETASKVKSDNGITVSEAWLSRNCTGVSEWKQFIKSIMELEDIGFIKCEYYSTSILVNIDYERLCKINRLVGRERGTGMNVIKAIMSNKSITTPEVEAIKMRKTSSGNGNSVIKQILDELCG